MCFSIAAFVTLCDKPLRGDLIVASILQWMESSENAGPLCGTFTMFFPCLVPGSSVDSVTKWVQIAM